MIFYEKYLKYKNKYLQIKGGSNTMAKYYIPSNNIAHHIYIFSSIQEIYNLVTTNSEILKNINLESSSIKFNNLEINSPNIVQMLAFFPDKKFIIVNLIISFIYTDKQLNIILSKLKLNKLKSLTLTNNIQKLEVESRPDIKLLH